MFKLCQYEVFKQIEKIVMFGVLGEIFEERWHTSDYFVLKCIMEDLLKTSVHLGPYNKTIIATFCVAKKIYKSFLQIYRH